MGNNEELSFEGSNVAIPGHLIYRSRGTRTNPLSLDLVPGKRDKIGKKKENGIENR